MVTTNQKRGFDPYAELGLPRDADAADVKSAFRRRARETHPDTGGEAEDFNKVQRAHLILIDPQKRKRFDETGESDDEQPANPDVEAYQLIAMMLEGMAMGDGELVEADLLNHMRECMGSDIAKTKTIISKLKRGQDRTLKVQKRFTRNGPGENLIERMLDFQFSNFAERIRGFEKAITDRQRVIELLAEYKFRRDEPRHMSILFTATSTASTDYGRR